jgi:hypothetical protein
VTLIGTLPTGGLDVVGDVHGELEVLLALVRKLGYDERGEHPKGRALVFVGDLVDRGPDSLGVVRWVKRCVDEHGGQCVLGNHELNLLRAERKDGNGWFFGEREGGPQVLADDQDREEIRDFLWKLPVAMEREDLRVVHACWREDAMSEIRAESSKESALQRDVALPDALAEALNDLSIDLHDRDQAPPLHPVLVEAELHEQNLNPIKLVTSGLERETESPFWAGGRWRVVERAPWFEQRLGREERVMCIDFSIGRRWRERERGSHFASDLAAWRWPEEELVFASS